MHDLFCRESVRLDTALAYITLPFMQPTLISQSLIGFGEAVHMHAGYSRRFLAEVMFEVCGWLYSLAPLSTCREEFLKNSSFHLLTLYLIHARSGLQLLTLEYSLKSGFYVPFVGSS